MMVNKNFGVLHIEVFIPPYAIKQTTLETEDNCVGKYVKGLGQIERSVNHFSEDVVSMALTVVKNALKSTSVSTSDIGRIDVGTETRTDYSKSIVSHLQQLIKNTDIEGIDCTNACFGGTMALFNALNWMYSPFWNGKYALVVTSDIAIYNGTPNATGGAGAVCMLIGPNAPLLINPVYCNFIQHAYDFFKPNPLTGTPIVDGPLSLKCYFAALIDCYSNYKTKSKISHLEHFDFLCFHTPFSKQVEKSILLLKAFDALNNYDKSDLEVSLSRVMDKYEIKTVLELLGHKVCFQECFGICKELIDVLVGKSLLLPRYVGNAYCSSLFMSLYSLMGHIKNKDFGVGQQQTSTITNAKIGMFSYGSGCMARFYSLDLMDSDLLTMNDPKMVLNREYIDYETFNSWISEFQNMRTTGEWENMSLDGGHKHYRVKSIQNWKRMYCITNK
eukprot:NODE_122_length_18870_cov_0.236908.p2 type:complete len:445 gc:universal NODE_122_length_18870_cov_0.236908:7162-8496(+)